MFKNQSNQVRAGWLILIAFILMFVGQILFTIPGMAVLFITDAVISDSGISIEVDGSNELIFLLTNGFGTIGGLVVTLLVWRFINREKLVKIGLAWRLKDLLFGLFLGALSITILFCILYLSGSISLVNPLSEPKFSIYTGLFFILFIFVGLFEEIFFRGYLIQTMASRHNKKWLIYVVSALLFSIVHSSNPNVTGLGLLNIALVGILFAYMFDVTKSLWLPIGYHITWNFFQGNVFGFAVSGLAPKSIYEINILSDNDMITGGEFGLEGGLMATFIIILGFFITYLYSGRKTPRDSRPFW